MFWDCSFNTAAIEVERLSEGEVEVRLSIGDSVPISLNGFGNGMLFQQKISSATIDHLRDLVMLVGKVEGELEILTTAVKQLADRGSSSPAYNYLYGTVELLRSALGQIQIFEIIKAVERALVNINSLAAERQVAREEHNALETVGDIVAGNGSPKAKVERIREMVAKWKPILITAIDVPRSDDGEGEDDEQPDESPDQERGTGLHGVDIPV